MGQKITVAEMIEQFGMTPAEAVDYNAVVTEGHTQEEWANKRGLDGHQSVGRNVRNATAKLENPRNIIDISTVIVDPDDIIEAIRFNGKPEGSKNQRSAVIRITPPFESESKASIFYMESGNRYPPEKSPKPLHIEPRKFIGETIINQPSRHNERLIAQEELDDPTEEEVMEWVQDSFEVWEEDARSSLCEEVDIRSHNRQQVEHIVSVKYEELS